MMFQHLAIFNVGGPEMIVIFAISLLLFGSERLPKLARGIGKSMGEFQKARQEFEYEITRAQEIGQLENNAPDADSNPQPSLADLEKELAELKALKAARQPPSPVEHTIDV